ncbi:alpha/beta hydrolase family protein [Nocardia tenerifensis]|uniref:alpha/beta hydrolase family protein n=1 Tax=Nocardia tenerifensis TaxID=228006 RepID=UPI0002EEAB8C|nr:alpha/beta fold hydrolase [Nocardia tenerifensis]
MTAGLAMAAVSTAASRAIDAETPVRVPDPSRTADGALRIGYGASPDNFGDLYLPDGPGPHPVIVLVHGGGWSQNRTLSQFAPHARALAEQGVAVWNIEYRRVNGAGGWPSTLTDADDAVAALATVVRQSCGDRLDLRRVHLAGHSAGGHLAAWVAGRRSSPSATAWPIRLRSATLMAAVLDLEYAVSHGRDAFVRKLLGGGPDEVPERYRVAAPINHLPTGIRVSALHGDRDRVVDLEQSRRYIAALDPADAELRVLPGIGHGEFTDPASPAWTATRHVLLDHVAQLR